MMRNGWCTGNTASSTTSSVRKRSRHCALAATGDRTQHRKQQCCAGLRTPLPQELAADCAAEASGQDSQ